MRKFSADFETTTEAEDCRVWAWGVAEVGNVANYTDGNDIETFMQSTRGRSNDRYYFHNLKFDGAYIIDYLFRCGYKHVTKKSDIENKTFTTLITDTGVFYSIKVYHEKKNKRSNTVEFFDSMKLFNMSVDAIAKGFKMETQKLEIDYHKPRPVGYEMDDQEREYLKHDVVIVATALDFLFKQGFEKMTIGSNALFHYKSLIGDHVFDRRFPVPDYDAAIRRSYKGGFTYLNPEFAGKRINRGKVFDVNSLYPWAMRADENKYPIGDGIPFQGKYVEDKLYNLYIQQFICNFKLKPGKIPTIQLKGNSRFVATEYLTDSNGEDVVLTLTNVDLELFFQHYDVYNVEWIDGYKFKSGCGLFSEYIDYWTLQKIQAKQEHNFALYITAKLFLNNLYGKFATNPNCRSKIPYYDDGRVKYTKGEKEERKPVYLPVGTFVTAYARRKTITSAQMIEDRYFAGESKTRFVYADTDSLHLWTPDDEMPPLDIDPYRLGAWAHETDFTDAKFLRAKCYMEKGHEPGTDEQDEWKITVAGMPANCYEHVTIDNFDYGASYEGKLTPSIVPGGVVLKEVQFTIQNIKKKA